jgi:group II intron reverse transcriptase/maturase
MAREPTKVKAHSLTGRITPALMLDAFQSVRRNRGAAGIDKVSIQMFQDNLEQNLTALLADLKQGTFEPKPLRRVYIPKGNDQFRPLGIPAVRDRVAQEVLRRLLSPIFERRFHDDSYGFRPGRNCHQAVERVLDLGQQGYRYVLDADIQGFFDNIPHPVIMAGLSAEVADGNILRLVEKFLRAGVMEQGVFKPTTVGTPQGGVFSPLLANIALDYLDWQLDDAGFRLVRYADDFVVLCQTERQAKEARDLVERLLTEKLGLHLSAEKTQVTRFAKGFSFLGFFISSWTVRMRDKSVQKLKDKIRELTQRKFNLDAELVTKLNRILRGTANYFAAPFAHCGHRFRSLDRWIRMRLRCMKFKRKWRTDHYRLRRKHFDRLGVLRLVDFCRPT